MFASIGGLKIIEVFIDCGRGLDEHLSAFRSAHPLIFLSHLRDRVIEIVIIQNLADSRPIEPAREFAYRRPVLPSDVVLPDFFRRLQQAKRITMESAAGPELEANTHRLEAFLGP